MSYAAGMMLVALAALAVVVGFVLYRQSRKTSVEPSRDTTPALDRWLRDALEQELAESVLGIRGSTVEERKKLAHTLADEPEAEVVGKIEETVKAVELEFVRYAHETDVEVTVRVRYEDGKTGATTRRLALDDVPENVRGDFKEKGATRVFRTWAFPWQRVHTL